MAGLVKLYTLKRWNSTKDIEIAFCQDSAERKLYDFPTLRHSFPVMERSYEWILWRQKLATSQVKSLTPDRTIIKMVLNAFNIHGQEKEAKYYHITAKETNVQFKAWIWHMIEGRFHSSCLSLYELQSHLQWKWLIYLTFVLETSTAKLMTVHLCS